LGRAIAVFFTAKKRQKQKGQCQRFFAICQMGLGLIVHGYLNIIKKRKKSDFK
jgi:hypothetical protein